MIFANKKIKEWITDIWKTKTYLDYDDLHIDIINKKLSKNQKEWFYKGIEYLKIAEKIKKEMNIPLKVFLSFSLIDSKKLTKVLIPDINSFIRKIDTTPPSLYLLEFIKIQNEGVLLNNNAIFFIPDEIGCFDIHFFCKEENTYRQSLWFFIKEDY